MGLGLGMDAVRLEQGLGLGGAILREEGADLRAAGYLLFDQSEAGAEMSFVHRERL